MLTLLAVVAVVFFVVGAILAVGGKGGLGPSLVVLGIVLGLIWSAIPARAHDLDHPELDDWYAGLMQPDVPSASCCGVADAYWCDDYYARAGKGFCKITDDRDDGPLKRPHVDVGTEIEIPDYKLKWDRSNPTGHGVVFLSRGQYVYCYVQPGGV